MNARSERLVLAPLLLLAACSESPSTTPPPDPVMPAGTTSAKPSVHQGMELPPSHPPIGGMRPLAFTAPEGWKQVTPGNPMRREEYVLAGPGKDDADAVVTVSVIPADQGGPVEDNLQRWAMQFQQPDGKSSRDAMKQSTRKVGDMNVIEVDISGTYVAPKQMGGTETYNEPNWRQILAWIQAPSGNYYVKLLGPAATVAKWESSFREYVSSAKAQ